MGPWNLLDAVQARMEGVIGRGWTVVGDLGLLHITRMFQFYLT